MPMLEGLGFTERSAVIIDFGSAYTKCGFAGDSGPRCIVPSVVKNSKTKKRSKIWQFKDEEELYELLKDFLQHLYFRHLLVTPKERRVVICESLLCPSAFRNTLARVLFRHFEVPSVLFGPSHLLTMLTLGTNTGLVIDLGYREAVVVPVYESISVMKALQCLPLGGQAIHRRLASLLETATVSTATQSEQPLGKAAADLSEEVIEDIKVKCCFVTNFKRAKEIQEVTLYGADEGKLPAPPPVLEYPLDGEKVLHINGKIREHTCEVLFEQDNEEQSVATILLDAIVQCPIDMRKQLAANIVVTGGAAMLTGFYHRLQQELLHLLKQPKYKRDLAISGFRFHQPPAKENCSAWLGGAMIGCLETLPHKSMSRDTYIQTGVLPDWCSLGTEPEPTKDKTPTRK
ncbi:actin-related protein 10-like [Liolophura sinensis]|uniref:actin-related protein 10-like n=1 Tax=Liolophura sinensis TaxID=3198878 RepID=UPI0031590C2F